MMARARVPLPARPAVSIGHRRFTAGQASSATRRPDVDFHAVATTVTSHQNPLFVEYGDTLATPQVAGISFDSDDDLGSMAGAFGITQVVDEAWLRIKTGVSTVETASGYGLDGAEARTNTAVWNDSPGNQLPSGYAYLTRYSDFHTYLMFKPAGPDSIWVPLKRIHWFFGFQAAPDANGYLVVQDHDAYENATLIGVDVSVFPTWDQTIGEALPADLLTNDDPWE